MEQQRVTVQVQIPPPATCFNCDPNNHNAEDGTYCTNCFETLFEKQFQLNGGAPRKGPPKSKPPPVPPKPTKKPAVPSNSFPTAPAPPIPSSSPIPPPTVAAPASSISPHFQSYQTRISPSPYSSPTLSRGSNTTHSLTPSPTPTGQIINQNMNRSPTVPPSNKYTNLSSAPTSVEVPKSTFNCAKCRTTLHGKTVETLSPGELVCRSCYDANIETVLCTKCHLPFTPGNTLVTYNHKPYHQLCFKCNQCSNPIGVKSFCNTEKSGVVCEDCYFAKTGKICVGCGGSLANVGFLFRDQPWHKTCFICRMCKTDLGDKEVFFKDGGLFCRNCYKETFVGKCAGCNRGLDGEVVEYEGKEYHNACFCCSACNRPFNESSFIPREGKVYCETCFCIQFGKQCRKCFLTISPTSGNGVVYRNEHYHRDCFTCTNCEQSLTGQMVHSNKDKQEPYCGTCYDELFSKRCTACGQIISGVIGSKYIAHEGKHWHEDCFNCKLCQSSLVNRKMLLRGTDVICGPCATYNLP